MATEAANVSIAPRTAERFITPEVQQHVLYRFMNATFREYPCPHGVVDDIWPEDVYALLLKHLPRPEQYTGIMATGRVRSSDPYATDTRFLFSLASDLGKLSGEQQQFWQEVRDFLFGPVFMNQVIRKFQPLINSRFQKDPLKSKLQILPTAELFRDVTGYHIGPHTDAPSRLLNMFFYLPEDDSRPHLGTAFYAPRDPQFRCPGGPHYNFDDFIKVYNAPFERNKLAIFFKNDTSFHGVEPIEEPDFARNTLGFYLRLQTQQG